jgi:uncharacterized protein (TIGR02265 family)
VSTEKLIFAQTFEGLFRSVQARLTPVLQQGLKARGVDPTRPLLPAYPHEVFAEVMLYLAAQLYPQVEEEEAVRLLGRGFMEGFGETMIGRAMLAAMRLIGPRRTLERVSRQFRAGNNYTETKLTSISERDYELWINEVRLPGWYIGIVGRGLELAGGAEVRVELTAREGRSGTFRVTWQ